MLAERDFWGVGGERFWGGERAGWNGLFLFRLVDFLLGLIRFPGFVFFHGVPLLVLVVLAGFFLLGLVQFFGLVRFFGLV